MITDINSQKNKDIWIIVLRLILEAITEDLEVLFFDESTFQNYSFKNKGWFLRRAKPLTNLKPNCHTIKILAIISLKGLQSLQLVSYSNGEIISTFLEQSLVRLIQNDPKKHILLILDNAKSNHVQEVKNLSKKFNLILLYNAVSSPQLNTIEYLFECNIFFIKYFFFISDPLNSSIPPSTPFTAYPILHAQPARNLQNVDTGSKAIAIKLNANNCANKTLE